MYFQYVYLEIIQVSQKLQALLILFYQSDPLLGISYIPNSIYNSIYYMNEYNSLKQDIIINDKNMILTEMDVLLLDRFGNNLNIKNDYSFTLRILYECVENDIKKN